MRVRLTVRTAVPGGVQAGAVRLALTLGLALVVGAVPAARAAKPRVPAPPAAPPAPTPADFKLLDPDDMLVVETNKGRIVVALSPLVAPASVARIKTLSRQHFYDGLTFFRVVDGFMDQTGDPTNKGDGDSKLPNLPAEFTFRRDASTPFVEVSSRSDATSGFIGALPVTSQPDDLMLMNADAKVAAWPLFCPGVLGMARTSDPASANSQFFFMRSAYPSLERKYTGFGRVVLGQAVVKSIKIGEPPPDPQDRMLSVRLGSDLAPADRPKIAVLDPRSAAFKGLVDKAKNENGADFTPCDVDIPVEVR